MHGHRSRTMQCQATADLVALSFFTRRVIGALADWFDVTSRSPIRVEDPKAWSYIA